MMNISCEYKVSRVIVHDSHAARFTVISVRRSKLLDNVPIRRCEFAS